ncbi:MAG: hypothetical protein ABWY54_04610, partial [Glaciihabitans sp.]
IGAATELVARAHVRLGAASLVALGAPSTATAADGLTAEALMALQSASRDSEQVATMLRSAMALYGFAETVNEQLGRALAARLGYAAGLLTPLLLITALPALGTTTAALILAGMTQGLTAREAWHQLLGRIRQHNGVLNDPLAVLLVRAAMGNSDDILGGVLRIPPEIVALLGEEGAGLTGLGTTAALVTLLARNAGTLRETGVAVTRTSIGGSTAPRSLAERANRIPAPAPVAAAAGPGERADRHTRRGAPAPAPAPFPVPVPAPVRAPAGATATGTRDQVRIDRYSTPGLPDRFEVYIAGTVDFTAASTEEPWDMTSNVTGIAGLPAGSTAAVKDAMAQAGVTPTTPVVLTGYSQGGLVASVLAASGQYTVTNVVTFGAPAGLVEIPPDIPVLSVRHSDDIVPALGGYDASSHALVVERELFAGVAVPDDEVFPAHRLDNYRATAALIDDAQSPQVRSALADLDAFAPRDVTTTVVTSTFHATRVADEEAQ